MIKAIISTITPDGVQSKDVESESVEVLPKKMQEKYHTEPERVSTMTYRVLSEPNKAVFVIVRSEGK